MPFIENLCAGIDKKIGNGGSDKGVAAASKNVSSLI
jgi:hypothetical protein